MRRLLILGAAALVLALGLGVAVDAQDQATPAPGACPSPVTGTPATVVMAPSPAGGETGTPVACPTPMGETPTAGQGAAAPSTAVTIEMVDIAFNPNAVTIPANTDVTVTLPNNGVTVHNFNIDELGIKTEDVPGGGSTTATINAPAGSYEFYCGIPGHREAGMVGTLTVQ